MCILVRKTFLKIKFFEKRQSPTRLLYLINYLRYLNAISIYQLSIIKLVDKENQIMFIN